jgi:hypothetical protein
MFLLFLRYVGEFENSSVPGLRLASSDTDKDADLTTGTD